MWPKILVKFKILVFLSNMKRYTKNSLFHVLILEFWMNEYIRFWLKRARVAVGAPQDRHDSWSSYSCDSYAFRCLDDLSKIVPLPPPHSLSLLSLSPPNQLLQEYIRFAWVFIIWKFLFINDFTPFLGYFTPFFKPQNFQSRP